MPSEARRWDASVIQARRPVLIPVQKSWQHSTSPAGQYFQFSPVPGIRWPVSAAHLAAFARRIGCRSSGRSRELPDELIARRIGPEEPNDAFDALRAGKGARSVLIPDWPVGGCGLREPAPGTKLVVGG